jgi:hypothetical protein
MAQRTQEEGVKPRRLKKLTPHEQRVAWAESGHIEATGPARSGGPAAGKRHLISRAASSGKPFVVRSVSIRPVFSALIPIERSR